MLHAAPAVNLIPARAPPRTIFGCRSHSGQFRSAGLRLLAFSSAPALGCTRSLVDAKEPGTRPMGPGDPLGDHGQRPIAPAVIFEPVLADEDDMGVSAPPPHQARAVHQRSAG